MTTLRLTPNVSGYADWTAVEIVNESDEILGTPAILKLQDGKWIMTRPGVSADLCHTDELNRIALDAP
jgi:hypothetical protein